MFQPRARRSMPRAIGLLAAVVACGLQAGPASAEPVVPTAAFAETPCAFPLAARQAVGFNVLCGTVRVPERHAVPEGRRIDLAVSILRSASPTQPPLVMLGGGPAGPSGDLVPAMVYRGLTFRRLLQQRDVIVFDQRGVGRSTPSLSCAVETVIARRPTLERALADCAARLRTWGVDVAAYASAENAHDVAALVAALGVPKVDLYGSSYGSRLALTVMRDHPEVVRSAILDAPVPLEADLASGIAVGLDRALRAVFARCAADRACRRAYPRLAADLRRAYSRLNRRPVPVRPIDLETGQRRAEVRVDGRDFVLLLHGLLAGGGASAVPAAITAVANGDVSLLAIVFTIAGAIEEEDLSLHGMYLSTMCQEEYGFSPPARVAAALRTTMVPVREAVAPEIGALFAACSAWPVGPAPVLETAPVHSEIPTLVLAGEFDPITPPAYAAMIDRDLPAATAVTVRGYGHGTVGLGPCPVAIAVRFLGDPTTRPDTRCAAAAPFRFEIPRRRGGLPTVGGGGEAAAALRRWRGSIMP